MRTTILIILLLSAGGCASTDTAALSAQPRGEWTPLPEEVRRLSQADWEGRYYFYEGRGELIFHNDESNVMIYVDYEVQTVSGLTRWTDYYGRTHTLDILKLQRAFNSFLQDKQCPSAWYNHNYTPVEHKDVTPVLVTGLMDRDTLLIPAKKFGIRLDELGGHLKGLGLRYQYEFADRNYEAELPATLTAILREGEQLVSDARDRLRRYEEIIQRIPLQRSKISSNQVSPDDQDTMSRFFAEDRAKPKPDDRPYWAVRTQFGLRVPIPVTGQDSTLRELDAGINRRRIENGLQVRVGVSFGQPEDLVEEYAVASELGPHLQEMGDAENAAEEAISKVEAQYALATEWIETQELAKPRSAKPRTP
jgi:hypothetical protein